LGVLLAPQRTHPLVCTRAHSYIYISCMSVSVQAHLNTRMHTHAHAPHSGKSPKNGPKMQRIWVSGGISGFLEAFLEARPPISGGTFLDSGGTNFWRHTFSALDVSPSPTQLLCKDDQRLRDPDGIMSLQRRQAQCTRPKQQGVCHLPRSLAPTTPSPCPAAPKPLSLTQPAPTCGAQLQEL